MDVRDINNVYVAEDCARTAGGAETIDGASVSGVQIHAPLIDAGTAAGTYYGGGELLVTDVSGRALTSTIVAAEGKAIPEIVIHQRSLNTENHFTSPAIKGASITSYDLIPYEAPVEHVAVVHTVDATLLDFEYMIKIRRIGTDNNKLKETSVKTAFFRSAVAGSTAAQIVTGLAAYINNNFNTDPLVPISAVVANVDELVISALPYTFEVGKFRYEKLNFVVELVNFTAEVEYNDKADLTVTDTYTQATPGAGTYEQVVQMERFGKLYTGANKNLQSPVYRRDIVALESDTAETYDTMVINWTNLQGDFSANVRQEGSLTVFLPVTNNATNQVGVATIGIMAVLDAYIVTEYGVGVAQIGNIT